MKAIWFENHLYQPLLSLDTKVVEISPAPLNRGERHFVEDLKAFHDQNANFFRTRELICSVTLVRGRGIGFFEADNFHPDFILWLLADGQQQMMFVDPKGIRHLGPNDPKIQFFETIKEIEDRLGRSRRVAAVLHRVEHSFGHDAHAVEHGEERDGEAERTLPGGGQGQLHWENAVWALAGTWSGQAPLRALPEAEEIKHRTTQAGRPQSTG